MLRRCAVAVAAAVALGGLVLPAQGQVSLAWKFQKGDAFFVESVSRTEQTVEAGETKTGFDNTVTTVTGFSVRYVGDDAIVLDQTIEGTKVEAKADGKDDATALPASRAAKALTGALLRVTLSPTGEVKSFEGYGELLLRLSGGNAQAELALRKQLPEQLIKEELLGLLSFLPDKPVSPGATWTRKVSEPLRLPGRLVGEAEYTYKGKGDGGELIIVTRTLKYEPPGKGAEEPAKTDGDKPVKGLQVVKGDVTIDEATGEVVFDAAAGRLVRQQFTTAWHGTFTLSQDDETTTATVRQTTQRTIRVLGENPLAKDEKK